MHLTDTYCALEKLSAEMVQMAENQAWDSLAAAQRKRAEMIGTLPPHLPAMSAHDTGIVRQAIHAVLEHDAAIRAHVTPWQESVRNLLALL